jgi:hypothetical protein
MQQVQSFEPLEYKLVYVDDKTFGQADNWEWIEEIGDAIYERNPEFLGFIVQTTVPMAQQYLEQWYDYGVRYVEVGVEIPDDPYLREMNKPYRMAQLNGLTEQVREFGKMGFIPNLIFGAPNTPYRSMAAWVARNTDIISFVNPYVLSQYHDSKGEMVIAQDKSDSDETSLSRSWLSDESEIEMIQWMRGILETSIS